MYNHVDTGQVPEFELHDVTARQAIMYEKTLEYSKLQLSAKCARLRITTPQNLKTTAEQVLAYEKALNGFASQKWSDHSLADVKFPSA